MDSADDVRLSEIVANVVEPSANLVEVLLTYGAILSDEPDPVGAAFAVHEASEGPRTCRGAGTRGGGAPARGTSGAAGRRAGGAGAAAHSRAEDRCGGPGRAARDLVTDVPVRRGPRARSRRRSGDGGRAERDRRQPEPFRRPRLLLLRRGLDGLLRPRPGGRRRSCGASRSGGRSGRRRSDAAQADQRRARRVAAVPADPRGPAGSTQLRRAGRARAGPGDPAGTGRRGRPALRRPARPAPRSAAAPRPADGAGRYLVERYGISYAPSLTALRGVLRTADRLPTASGPGMASVAGVAARTDARPEYFETVSQAPLGGLATTVLRGPTEATVAGGGCTPSSHGTTWCI